MTRDQIKAELRRSACEDVDPWRDVENDAFWRVFDFISDDDDVYRASRINSGVFFLLVAEAL